MKQIVFIFFSALILSAGATTCKADEYTSLQDDNNKTTCPVIGAIRWDAWFGNKDIIGRAVASSLSPEKWHYRIPLCAKVLNSQTVSMDCASQAVMEQEISYAKNAGIDYWAFVLNEENSQMGLAFKNYLSSSGKSAINFALIALFGRFWMPNNYKTSIDRLIKLMSDSSYQKVMKRRPLIYVGFLDDRWLLKWENAEAIKAAFAEFRQKAVDANLANPYIVVMDPDPKRARQLADRYGFDAISAYAFPGSGGIAAHHYKMLASSTEQFWQRAKATGAQVVPIVMAGWDRRPRIDNPVPWEQGVGSIDKYYDSPTPDELAQHLKNALNWAKFERSHTEANTLIIYAWNEFDEGGWLAPTRSEGTARIEALGSMVRRECAIEH